MMMMMMIPGT